MDWSRPPHVIWKFSIIHQFFNLMASLSFPRPWCISCSLFFRQFQCQGEAFVTLLAAATLSSQRGRSHLLLFNVAHHTLKCINTIMVIIIKMKLWLSPCSPPL